MIDSVLKGTGNSRFLKSAVPAGTSWADALAMLQAGTFPIDFNGINTDGFQQVGTPLNKANLLKDATAAQIGLPPSTTPDGMFQALGNTGELHVWRKTVVVGSYYIGATQPNYGCICRNTGSASFGVKIQYASEITVDSHENRNLVSPSDMTIIANNSGITSPSATSVANTLKGKFIRLAGIPDGYQNSELKYAVGSVFYCPESISCFVKDAFNDGNHYICLDGIKNVPTKTENVVTYPVSTNPNAYQEGDDAKAAGYTLGEVVMGSFRAGATNYTISYNYEAASELTVSDDGRTVSMTSPSTGSFGFMGGLELGDDPAKIRAFMLGKFVRCTAKGDQLNEAPDTKYPFNTIPSDIVYIPSNAQITIANGDVLVDRYQPVTGYAAIPAGTTIEYLGKLGDKARVQVVSYVGTGTYGSSNPNSLTFDFPPKVVMFLRGYKESSTQFNYLYGSYGSDSLVIISADLSNIFAVYNGFGRYNSAYAKKDLSGRTITWYSNEGSNSQANASGVTHYFLAIG